MQYFDREFIISFAKLINRNKSKLSKHEHTPFFDMVLDTAFNNFVKLKIKSTPMKLELPLDKEHKLIKWANSIRGHYGHPVYLVGSQLTDKENPRDVDIVLVLPNDEFTLRFGNVYEWIKEGVTGNWTSIRWSWSEECIKRWKEGCIETDLNLDFKIEPMMQHIGLKHLPSLRLDTYDESN